MPMATEISAVIANHSSVCPASRAAFVTFRRFAMEETIASSTSGGTIARSRSTKEPPMVESVSVSQFGSPSAVGPMARARNPRRSPRARPSTIWVPNEGIRHRRRVGAAVVDEGEGTARPSGSGVRATPTVRPPARFA